MSANLPPYLLDSQYVVSHNTLQQFTLPARTDGSALHRPFSATRIAGGRNTCSIENLIERLRRNMIENLDDWNETKNDSDSTFRADQMTWEVTSIQQVPHDSSLLAFDAKGSFPYTFLAGQNSKHNTMTFWRSRGSSRTFHHRRWRAHRYFRCQSTTSTVSFAQHDIDSITIDNRSEVIFAYPQRTEDGHFF